jgi:hypothetical protein
MCDQTAKSNRSRADLQLLAPPARPARVPYLPARRPQRRPGERREPLNVDLAPPLLEAAARRRLDAACAAELCLERALVIADLVALERPRLYEPLLTAATAVRVARPLPAAKARYLQMLVAALDRCQADAADADAPVDSDVVVDVPLRLFPRVIDVADELPTCGDDEVAEALRLEIAAASTGRTMSEWAALTALRLVL